MAYVNNIGESNKLNDKVNPQSKVVRLVKKTILSILDSTTRWEWGYEY
jgi:hypothetical protein